MSVQRSPAHQRPAERCIDHRKKPDQMTQPSARGAKEPRTRRRRRRYVPGPTAAPEVSEETLTIYQWQAIHRYRNAASRERTGWLDAKRKAEVGPLLDRLEEQARREGIP